MGASADWPPAASERLVAADGRCLCRSRLWRCAGADDAVEAQAEQERELPAKRAGLERELNDIQQRLDALKGLQPLAARCHKLRQQELPDLLQSVDRLKVEAVQEADASMAAQDEHKEAQEALQVLRQFCPSVCVQFAWCKQYQTLLALVLHYGAVAGELCCAASCAEYASSPQAAKGSGLMAGGVYLFLDYAYEIAVLAAH